MASLVLGFQGLPYQMPARCLIGTASWCLYEAWDRRVAQRYIDFAFGLERCENWDRIEPAIILLKVREPLARDVGTWLVRCSDRPAAYCSHRQGGHKQSSRRAVTQRRGLGVGWGGWAQALPVLVQRTCSLAAIHSRGCKSALRNPKSTRRSWSPSACCMSDRPGGPECTHGARASSSASTLAQPRCRPFGGARRWGPWQ